MFFRGQHDFSEEHARAAAVRKWRNASFAGLCFALVIGLILVLLIVYGPILINNATVSTTSPTQIPAPTMPIPRG